MRELRRDEVKFHYWTTDEDAPVRGHFASGDDEQDKRDEDEILQRLDAGDQNAWCMVWCSCRWWSPRDHMHQVEVNVGCCNFDSDATSEQMALEHGLDGQALEALMELLIEVCDEAEAIQEALGGIDEEHPIPNEQTV